MRASNRAAHILGQAARRLSAGWHETDSYAPVLWETFFEGIRFNGASYRAAHSIWVGQITGRAKPGRTHEHALATDQPLPFWTVAATKFLYRRNTITP